MLTTCTIALIHQQVRIKKPANRLKLRPQHIDLSSLNLI